MKIKPMSDRVLLKPITDESNTTKSGIYIPENENKERPFIYEVLEVGPDVSVEVKVGDKILSGQYSGDDINLDGEKFKILASEYILAIIED
ncbi:MAG: co-chaperone GroES [Candidatus Gracilibacteria bacterium]|nr:co-chaperone GroES [Candidatus Gracilibacteria bacterium]